VLIYLETVSYCFGTPVFLYHTQIVNQITFIVS